MSRYRNLTAIEQGQQPATDTHTMEQIDAIPEILPVSRLPLASSKMSIHDWAWYHHSVGATENAGVENAE